jgi:hypothetical protein
VTDNKLEYHHFSNAAILALVGPDGSFKGSGENHYFAGRNMVQVQTLEGTIVGGAITAKTDVGTSCSYQLTLKKF